MAVILIAACAGAKQVIGNKGALPWHFPADLKFFKQTTLDKTILMGRVTYESILQQFSRPLPRRTHYIVTRNPDWSAENVTVFHSVSDALRAAKDDIYVVGGAQIYKETLPLADKVLLTHIPREIEGDAFFPMLDPAIWQITREEKVIDQDTPLLFREYVRKA